MNARESSPLLWVADPRADQTLARRVLTHGRPAQVALTNGPPHGTATVHVDDTRGAEAQTLEIALDQDGHGRLEWLVPVWTRARFQSAGCPEVLMSVEAPTPARVLIARRISLTLRNLARTIEFLAASTPERPDLGFFARLGLLRRIVRNRRALGMRFSVHEHLRLAAEILSVPPSVEGDVVECGAWNGASTITLSLTCALVGRRLFVCDSFEGLPTPAEDEETARLADGSNITQWLPGAFASEGGLEGVRERVGRYGALDVCRFVEGYFEDTLDGLPTESVVFVYEDADLPSSIRTCLQHLWPRLAPGCRFYSDEPWYPEVVALFYDREWWQRELGTSPPGFVGSDIGLPMAPSLGFAIKPLEAAAARERPS